MSNKHNERTDEAMRTEEESVSVNSAQALARRRWLRSGLKAAPVVVASLAARPALAWHCNAPSAWGSRNTAFDNVDQEAATPLSGSLTRLQSQRFENGAYWFGSFVESNTGWNYIKGNFNGFPDNIPEGDKNKYLQGKLRFPDPNHSPYLTVERLCNGLNIITPSGSGSSLPKAMIAAGRSGIGQDAFGASMLIALINSKRGKIPSQCVPINDPEFLVKMASDGYYAPGNGSVQPWDKNQIADYLHYNWIARR